jgi:hypothetical protein
VNMGTLAMVSSASLETHHSPTHEFLSNFTLEKKGHPCCGYVLSQHYVKAIVFKHFVWVDIVFMREIDRRVSVTLTLHKWDM